MPLFWRFVVDVSSIGDSVAEEKPEWIDGFADSVVASIARHHAPAPDRASQVRQWLALILAIAGLASFIQAGRSLGAIETTVQANTDRALVAAAAHEGHVDKSTAVHEKIADILRLHEARTARIEGIIER